ncbi:hypothetical protein NHQ30_007016 [Ciborinia camelliae]|nr:hypothetical protein NHQ30_007016 [Ciborinia camelliae]
MSEIREVRTLGRRKGRAVAKMAGNNRYQNELKAPPKSDQVPLPETPRRSTLPKEWTQETSSSTASSHGNLDFGVASPSTNTSSGTNNTLGPSDPNARFWTILATSKRNRSVSKPRKTLGGAEFGKKEDGESERRPTQKEGNEAGVTGGLMSGGTFGKTRIQEAKETE